MLAILASRILAGNRKFRNFAKHHAPRVYRETTSRTVTAASSNHHHIIIVIHKLVNKSSFGKRKEKIISIII